MASMALRIRRCRTLMRLSQGELARRVGVHRSAVTQWEREGGTRPCIEHLAAISIVINVPFEWLATGRLGRRPDAGKTLSMKVRRPV